MSFPVLGHLRHLTDNGFGVWTGTAVNDTSVVVAAGFAFSQAAGTIATIIRLTRTTLIIPPLLGFGLVLPFVVRDETVAHQTLAGRVYDAVPALIILFVPAAAANTAGLMGTHAMQAQLLGRLTMVVALAGVGLQGQWRAFAGAGVRPLAPGPRDVVRGRTIESGGASLNARALAHALPEMPAIARYPVQSRIW